MLKVDNKKAVHELAKATYKANRKRNILTIAAIFLTTFLLSTLSILLTALHDFSVFYADNPVCQLGNFFIVGNHHNGLCQLLT